MLDEKGLNMKRSSVVNIGVMGIVKNNIAKILFGIFIVALFLRLLAVFSQKEIDRVPRSDASGYDEMAVNLVSGNGFSQSVNGSMTPVGYRTPIYPMFMAGIYYIFGHHYITVKIIQAILGALFCIIAFFIANIIYDDAAIGLIASLFAALYKPFISGFCYYGGPALFYSENLLMFIVGLAILALLYFIKKGNIKIGMLAGFLMGLAILTRPEFAIFPVLLAIYLLYASHLSIKEMLRKYFIVYLFIILTMSPWVVRNYIVYKEFIPLSTGGGYTFLRGNNALANGGLSTGTWSWENADVQNNKEYYKMGIEYLKDNPKRIPSLFIRKILVHWAPFEDGFKWFNSFYAFILFFGSIGILFFRKKIILENILLLIFLSTTLAAVITYGDPRYRYPYELYLIIFSALTFSKMIRNIRQKFV